MPTEITATIDLNDNSEKRGLTLNRVRVDVKVDKEQMPGTDYPAGIIITDLR
jgi:hypothetical protein